MLLGVLNDVVRHVDQGEPMCRLGLFQDFEPGFQQVFMLRMMIENPKREGLNTFLSAVDQRETFLETG